MNEDVGMKRRRSGALIVGAAAGVAAMWAVSAMAVSPGSPYTNAFGVNNGLLTPGRLANMAVNPGHTGSWLWGAYYDVRPVTNADTGTTDNQDFNLQVLNTNPKDPVSDNYNPFGGLIARVRFYEGKTSREVLDFDIVLSCGEVWTGKVSLPDPAGKPVITSADPISPCDDPRNTPTQFITEPALAGGVPFPAIPQGLTAADIQRGYFSVTAMESLPCEPIGGQVVRTGNTWNRLCVNGICPEATPTDALAAEGIMIRVGAGVSHIFNADAITRYIADGFGSAYAPCSSGSPDVDTCIGFVNGGGFYSGLSCVDQMNFILSKSRLTPQWDIQNITGGSTRVVVTLPTKSFSCNLNAQQTDYNNVPNPPFLCQGVNGPQGGELIGCVAYNRIEDFQTEGGCPISPCPPRSLCSLPREVTVLNMLANDSPTSQAVANVSDVQLDVTGIPREHLAGWLDLNLVRDPTNPGIRHEEFGLDPNFIDFLGVGYTRYEGLPTVSLILQEYLNSNLSPHGVYGGAVPPPYEVFYAFGS